MRIGPMIRGRRRPTRSTGKRRRKSELKENVVICLSVRLTNEGDEKPDHNDLPSARNTVDQKDIVTGESETGVDG